MSINGDSDQTVKRLVELYRSPTSNIFLTRNAQEIYKAVKNDAKLHPTSYKQIWRLQQTVESSFRGRESRILRGKNRYLSYRPWLNFSPCQIILGDLAFIPNISGKTSKHHVVCVFMDSFSKLVFMKVQKSTLSSETLNSFEEALPFFYGNNVGRYRLFCSDKGTVDTRL